LIGIIDYGTSNFVSLTNALQDTDLSYEFITDKTPLNRFDKFIFPGVGSFDYCINELRKKKWLEELADKVLNDQIPLLGICIGFHLLMSESEEGNLKGLGWIEGKIEKIKPVERTFKVPHVGWSRLANCQKDERLLQGIDNDEFYFIHSYSPKINDKKYVSATFNYNYEMTAAAEKNNIFGVQFHPEKSFDAGLKVLRNFGKI